MAKYTTEVRSICETYSGFKTEQDGTDVDTIINNSWEKIFGTNFPVFEESYRKTLCCKIIKHFYTREIGFETVGLWKLKLQQRMSEIMPYYNQLYLSEKIKFEPLNDVNYTRAGDSNNNNTENITGNTTNKSESTANTTNSSNNTNAFSNTPQGKLEDVKSLSYLTTATIDTTTDTGSSNNTGLVTGNDTRNSISKNTENHTETINGKMGTTSYSQLLKEYRETFLNIDMAVINELNDLFMLLW